MQANYLLHHHLGTGDVGEKHHGKHPHAALQPKKLVLQRGDHNPHVEEHRKLLQKSKAL